MGGRAERASLRIINRVVALKSNREQFRMLRENFSAEKRQNGLNCVCREMSTFQSVALPNVCGAWVLREHS